MRSNIPFDIGSLNIRRIPKLPHKRGVEVKLRDTDGLTYWEDIVARQIKGRKYYA